MLVMLMFLNVLSEHTEPFIVATLEMAHASLRERGCRRFEVIREEANPTRFVFYQLFNSRADGELHLQMEHYANWQTATAAMLAEPARVVTYSQLF
jgi:autoinducer 2-degrading protein